MAERPFFLDMGEPVKIILIEHSFNYFRDRLAREKHGQAQG